YRADRFLAGDRLNQSRPCGEPYNRTELIRLESQLRGWLTRFKQEETESKRRQQQQRPHNSKRLLYDSKHIPIPRLKLWMQKQKYVDYLGEHFDEPAAPVTDQLSPFIDPASLM